MTYTPVVDRGYLSVPPGCPQCAGEDVTCGVHVSVCMMPARDAPEYRLALTGLGCDMPTGVTGFRRVGRVDFDNRGAGDPGLMLQGQLETTPALVQDGPVQTSLLRNVDTGLPDGPRRARGHVLHRQGLYADQRIVPAHPVSELNTEVGASCPDTRPHLAQLGACPRGMVRRFSVGLTPPPMLPGRPALQREHPALLTDGHKIPVVQAAAGVGNGDFHPPVHTGRRVRSAMPPECGFAVFDQDRHPPMPGIKADCRRPDHPGHRPGPAHPDPAQLRQTDLPGLTAQALHDQRIFTLRKPHRRPPTRLGTPPHFERPMLPARPVQIHQRLLQHVRRRFSQPGKAGLRFGHLPGLLHIVHPCTTSAVFPALLQTGVPHRAAHTSPRLQHGSLLHRESKPVLEPFQHTNILKGGYDKMFTSSSRPVAAFPSRLRAESR